MPAVCWGSAGHGEEEEGKEEEEEEKEEASPSPECGGMRSAERRGNGKGSNEDMEPAESIPGEPSPPVGALWL